MTEIRIKLADPGLDEGDRRAVTEVLDSGWLVNGPRAKELGARLASHAGRRRGITFSSGTTALVAAMRALGIGPGSTVIVPAFTFPAPAAAAAFLGARVRLSDVEPDTFCLSCETLEPLLDDGTSLVVAIDQFGVPAPAPALEALLASREIPLLVDAACSIGSTLDGKPCGAYGAAAVFSFHPRKVVTTGEGGAVVTDLDDAAREMELLANHGMEGGGFSSTGVNLRLGELGAAVGLSQLNRLDEIVAKRRALAAGYRELPLRFQEAPPGATLNHQTLAAVLPEPLGADDRGDLFGTLREKGIEATVASYCLGSVPAIRDELGLDPAETPVAAALHDRGIALPLHPGLTPEDVDEVVQAVGHWLVARR